MTGEERRVLKTNIIDSIHSLDAWRQEDVERGGIRAHLQCTKRELEFLLSLIENTEALEGMTNGEVLCRLFPNMHYTLSDKSPRVVTTIGVVSSFDLEWWNAPYRKR